MATFAAMRNESQAHHARAAGRSWGLASALALLGVTVGSPLSGARGDDCALAAPMTSQVCLLREARAALDRSDEDGAAAALARLVDSPLAAIVALPRARIEVMRDRAQAARELLDAALERDPPGEVQAELEAARGRLALAESRLAEGLGHFRRATEVSLDRERAATLSLELAEWLEAQRLPGDALAAYRRTWQRWPRSRASVRAFQRSRFLEDATSAAPASPRAQRLFADALRGTHRCPLAVEVYGLLSARDDLAPETRARVQRGLATCLMAQREFREAEKIYRELLRESPHARDLQIALARSVGRAGHRAEAVKSLLGIARHSRGRTRARARYLAALYLEDFDSKRARALLERVERERRAGGYPALARWRLAWSDVRADRSAAAEKRLRELAVGHPSDIEVQRARYWLARVRLAAGKRELGRRDLRTLVEEVPLSYYGLLAAEQLGDPPVVERPLLSERTPAAPDPALERARELIEGGFPALARLELESRLQAGRLDREARLRLAGLLRRVGEHYRAVRLVVDGFGDTLEEGIDRRWRDAWELAWPRPYSDKVEAAVSEFNGDPSLVYAVMREESTFRPLIESPVGARGLMQIIPPTGRRIAKALGATPFEPGRLFDAGTNVRFGTWYLESLLRRFARDRPHAIAAYNAGPEAVVRWVEDASRLDSDTFVDSIPYGETRRYVRRVVRSMKMYRLLYPDASPQRESRSQPVRAVTR